MKRAILVYPSCLYTLNGWGAYDPGINNPVLDMLSTAVADLAHVTVLDLMHLFGYPRNAVERERFLKSTRRLFEQELSDTDVVGISCWTSLNYLSTIEVARIIKTIRPACKIVVGGYHPTLVPKDFLRYPSLFDHIVIGPGEQALRDILSGQCFERVVKGVLTEKSIAILSTQTPPLRHYEAFKVYLSRGCPYCCAFCIEHSLNSCPWTALPAVEAADLIARIDRTRKASAIVISDACFGFRRSWRRKFLTSLIRRRIKTPFWLETRPDLLEREDIELFARLPCRVDMGLDSGSERMLRVMKKTQHPRQYLDHAASIADLLHRNGVSFRFYLIFNHPGETPDTITDTLNFIQRIQSLGIPGEIFIPQGYFFTPGSDHARHLRRYYDEYGTVVLAKQWWKMKGNHFELARFVKASRSIARSYDDIVHYWKDPFRKQCREGCCR